MLPISSSPCARDVAAWVAGGDPAAFTAALAAHETASWSDGCTGVIDESVAAFDHQEQWIARRLAIQGHNVIALPTRHLAGLRSPDAAVSGLLTEFKTYTGQNPRQLLARVSHALPQADRVVVGIEASWDLAMVRSVFRTAIDSACRRGMRAVTFIGDSFQLEWGDWNAGFTASESILGEQSTGAGVLRRQRGRLEASAPTAQAEPNSPALPYPGAASVSGTSPERHTRPVGFPLVRTTSAGGLRFMS